METTSMVNVNIPTIAATIVNFLVLVWVIKHFFYDKINNFMKGRTDEIASEISEAESLKEEGNIHKTKYEAQLETIEEQSRKLISEATEKAQQRKAEILKEAQEEAEQVLARTQVEVQREKEKALEDVKTNIIDISLLAAEKVIKDKLDQKQHEKIVQNFIEEIGEIK